MSGYLLALAFELAADVTQRRSAKSLRFLYMHESSRARLWHLQAAPSTARAGQQSVVI
jgi:hypothetical protein